MLEYEKQGYLFGSMRIIAFYFDKGVNEAGFSGSSAFNSTTKYPNDMYLLRVKTEENVQLCKLIKK